MELHVTGSLSEIRALFTAPSSVILERIGEVSESVSVLAIKLTQVKEIVMATAEQFTAGFARLDAATTAVATLIRDLIAKQQAGGMTAAEEDAAQARLLAAADALEAMAASPTDPVPVPVPEVPQV